MKKVILCLILLVGIVGLFAETAEGSLGWDKRGYLVFKSEDGNFQLRMDTRFYINGSFYMDDPDEILSNQTNLRKARFAIKTRLWNYWSFEWDIDVAEGDLVEIKDLFVSYTGFNNSHLKFGNFKQAFGMEELSSSRYLVFPERALPMLAFETDRQFGLEYSRWGYLGKIPFNLRSSVYTQTLANESKADYEKEVDETGMGLAARLVVGPELSDDIMIHGGVAMVYDTPFDDSEIMDFKSEAETKNGDLEFLDTDKIREVDHALRYGLEGALQYKNFHLQGEYVQTQVIRIDESKAGDATFEGGYAYLTWIMTGERRPWSNTDGEFGQVIPKNKKSGAWELAARYSHLNLNDGDAYLSSPIEDQQPRTISGGAGNIITLGLNWYANPNVKFQLAYSMVDLSQNANSEGDYNFDEDGYDFDYIQFMSVFSF